MGRCESAYAHLSQSSRYTYARRLRLVLDALHAAGAANLSPLVRRVTAPQPRLIRPTSDELTRALAVPHLGVRWVVTCAADIGLRHKTAEGLTPRHLATGAVVTATKRGRVVRLPITPRIAALVRLCRPTDDEADVRFVDLLHDRKAITGPQTIGQAWCRWKAQAGLPPGLRIHDLRRDFAHRSYAVCRDVRPVQGALGHESPITTLRYLHLAAPTIEASTVFAALHPSEEIL